jgi:hypothetical protein
MLRIETVPPSLQNPGESRLKERVSICEVEESLSAVHEGNQQTELRPKSPPVANSLPGSIQPLSFHLVE